MLATLQQESFLVGATLVLIYQAAKFGEWNMGDPITSRYMALVPGAKVRDFAGPYAYHIALIAFLSVSLVVYFLCCQISPKVLAGAAKLFDSPDVEIAVQGIPYPLYVAALFMGLTQPVIPVLSRLGDAQRDFFHDRIEVPRRIIDVSETLINAIEARAGADKRRLANELRKLAGREFLSRLQSHGDIAYYRLQLEKLKVNDESALNTAIKESSAKDLRGLIERLVLCALVAVMRRSGPNSLIKVAECLGASHTPTARHKLRYYLSGFIASGVVFFIALVATAHVLDWLDGPVASLVGTSAAQQIWPKDLENVGYELWVIVPPFFVCLVIAVSLLATRERASVRPSSTAAQASHMSDLVEFFRSSASVLLICFAVSVLLKFGQMFHEYGTFYLPGEARSLSRLILPPIQSLIPVAVCLFTTWYLVACDSPHRRSPTFAGTMVVIGGATGLIGLSYGLIFVTEYVRTNPASAPGWDGVLFGVIANVLVAICAFASIALFFKTRKVLPPAARGSDDRRRIPPAREPGRPQGAVQEVYSRVPARTATARRAGR